MKKTEESRDEDDSTVMETELESSMSRAHSTKYIPKQLNAKLYF